MGSTPRSQAEKGWAAGATSRINPFRPDAHCKARRAAARWVRPLRALVATRNYHGRDGGQDQGRGDKHGGDLREPPARQEAEGEDSEPTAHPRRAPIPGRGRGGRGANRQEGTSGHRSGQGARTFRHRTNRGSRLHTRSDTPRPPPIPQIVPIIYFFLNSLDPFNSRRCTRRSTMLGIWASWFTSSVSVSRSCSTCRAWCSSPRGCCAGGTSGV